MYTRFGLVSAITCTLLASVAMPAHAQDEGCKTEPEIMSFLKEAAGHFPSGAIIKLDKTDKVSAFFTLWVKKYGPVPNVDKPDHVEIAFAAEAPNALVIFLTDGKTCQTGPAVLPNADLKALLDEAVPPSTANGVTAPEAAKPTETVIAPTVAELPDPFASQEIKEGDVWPELTCMKRADLATQVAAHDGSKLVEMTHDQLMFYKGWWWGLPFTPKSYPIGQGAVYAVRAIEDPQTHKAAMEAVVAIEMGETMVCNKTVVTDMTVRQLFQVAGDKAGGS